MEQIVGIALLRDEDLYVERALSSVLSFCDKLIVVDNCSKDKTPLILKHLEAKHPTIAVYRSANPKLSHDLLQTYVGSDTWIFGVDGDEVYDPRGLEQLRLSLLDGGYDQWWALFGNVVNVISKNVSANTVSGYSAPPCRSMTKLYNFKTIKDWTGNATQRLHGGTIAFQKGFDATMRLNLHEEHAWETSPFRCLHMCFVPRSSLDSEHALRRPNVSEVLRTNIFKRLLRFVKPAIGSSVPSAWKKEKYMRGPLVTVDASPFFGADGLTHVSGL